MWENSAGKAMAVVAMALVAAGTHVWGQSAADTANQAKVEKQIQALKDPDAKVRAAATKALLQVRG